MPSRNVVYDNFFLSNEVEDQFNSHLDLQRFCTIDRNLTGTPGMLRKVNVYRATDGTQKLAMGVGNTASITVQYTPLEYRILLAQNRFQYYDEQAMTDPMVVPTGVRHMGTDMFNTVNRDVFFEFNRAPMVHSTTKFDFAAFADASALLNLENLENVELFGFVSPFDVAKIRTELLGSLQYVEAFARTGYIGTVAGINLFTKKDADRGVIIIATKEAVTVFVKTGTQIEQDRDKNTRRNDVFSRKYYLAAMTDETKAVKIVSADSAIKIMDINMAGSPVMGAAVGPLPITYTGVPASDPSLAYRWLRGKTAVGPYVPITGATSASYTPDKDDVGFFLKLEVTATGSALDVRESNAKKVIALLATDVVTLTGVAIDGTPKVGVPSKVALTFSADPIADPILAYKWQVQDNSSYVDITGATNPTYTPVVAQVGKKLKVIVTASGTASGTNVTSSASEDIEAADS